MVRDASGKDQFPPGTGGAPKASNQLGRSPTNNLTHELAQLLAATIAQSQSAHGNVPRQPTGAELTNLARLVSATSGQRTLAPVFKDGLSSLSYAPSHQTLRTDATDPGDLAQDDEPMPIPSTWRQPAAHDDERWVRQQMGAALLGLAAGLAIVVPTVLWLSGWFGPQKAKSSADGQIAATSTDSRPAEVRTVRVQVRPVERPNDAATPSPFVTGSLEARQPIDIRPPVPQPAQMAAVTKLAEPRNTTDDLLAQAARRIEGGDVTGARDILATAEDGSPGQAPVSFALAETYDPNMLAAWGTRGVAADVARARALYHRALEGGVRRAQARLDALK